MTPPQVLVVDDGELARLPARLARLSVDFVRVERPDRDTPLEPPRDLLLTSGPRAMAMPPFSRDIPRDAAPVWVCIYDQDFLPLRERLRALGVHFLVSGRLPPRTFDLFLQQLLHRGRERRRVRRIPLRCAVEVEQGVRRWSAGLLELSRESCLFRLPDAVASLGPGTEAVVRLPPELMGERRLDLGGRVVRTVGTAQPGGPQPGAQRLAVLAFRDLDPEAKAALDDVVTGGALGTQVTPLAPEPGPSTKLPDGPPSRREAGEARAVDTRRERRRAPRHRYERRVEALCWRGGDGPRVALGRDLSVSGMRLVTSPPPPVGAEVALALYGGAREEPVVVRGRVVRSEEIEAALRFEGLAPGERRGLERLLGAAPHLEDLRGQGEPVLVAELL